MAPSALRLTSMITLPRHLAGKQAEGLVADEPIAQFEIGSQRNFVYLILDRATRSAAWIDPQRDLSVPLAALSAHGFTLTRILLTHTHSDHTAGVPELVSRFPHVKVGVHQGDRPRIAHKLPSRECLVDLRDGEALDLGETSIHVLHTPGHSPGECCYLVSPHRPAGPSYLFTGDTVFIRDCGRTDLDGGSNEQMFESLQKIRALEGRVPGPVVILPGHHYAAECASTLEAELRESPPFLCKSVKELSALP